MFALLLCFSCFVGRTTLVGTARTIIVATIIPTADNCEETLSMLCYAHQAKLIVNHIVVNEDPNSWVRENSCPLTCICGSCKWRYACHFFDVVDCPGAVGRGGEVVCHSHGQWGHGFPAQQHIRSH